MSKAFQPSPELVKKLEANRNGNLTPQQRTLLMMASIGVMIGLACMSAMLLQLIAAITTGIAPKGLVTWIFFAITMLMFGYLGLTLYVNARSFVPDLLSSTKVKQSRGKLKIRVPQRERWELPFSYIVGDYSFAPFDVPDDVPMEKDREYIVYYLARTRTFLSIEPAND